MSRSGYVDDLDHLDLGRWRGRVKSAIRGNRGQSFLRELAAAMDAMTVKELIRHELIDEDGQCCTIGVVCKKRGIDVTNVDVEDYDQVGKAVDIAGVLAAEIEYMNDEWGSNSEKPQERWVRMRKWVASQIK